MRLKWFWSTSRRTERRSEVEGDKRQRKETRFHTCVTYLPLPTAAKLPKVLSVGNSPEPTVFVPL